MCLFRIPPLFQPTHPPLVNCACCKVNCRGAQKNRRGKGCFRSSCGRAQPFATTRSRPPLLVFPVLRHESAGHCFGAPCACACVGVMCVCRICSHSYARCSHRSKYARVHQPSSHRFTKPTLLIIQLLAPLCGLGPVPRPCYWARVASCRAGNPHRTAERARRRTGRR